MGFLDAVRKALGAGPAKSSGGGRSQFGDDPGAYWIYARCRRCGEPLRARVNLANDLSIADGGEGWVVRKGLRGSGKNLCFQAVEVTLSFDQKKAHVVSSEVEGGTLITAEEYQVLVEGARNAETDSGRQLEDEQDASGGG